MADNTELEHTFSHAVPQLFASLISVVLIILSLCFYDWRLSVALLAPLPLAVLIHLGTRRLLRGRFQENYRLKRQVTEDIQQGLENICEIKAYSGEEAYLEALDHSLHVLEGEMIRDELLASACMHSSVILLRLGLAFVAILGASLLQAGELDLVAYLVFLVFGSSVYIPIEEVLNYSILLSYLDVRISRMRQIDEMPTQTGKAGASVRRYDITFDHVTFAYQEGQEVLHDISFTARQGQVTALVGASGGGKSTIAKLAARFWDIDAGAYHARGTRYIADRPRGSAGTLCHRLSGCGTLQCFGDGQYPYRSLRSYGRGGETGCSSGSLRGVHQPAP